MAKSVKRKFLTFEEKNTILKELERGKAKIDILKTYGIPKSSLCDIIKNKENIIMMSNDERFKNKKTKRLTNDELLEECLLTWFRQARAKGEPISGPILQEKALQLNNLLNNLPNFKASCGWLEKFKNRYGIQFTMKGEILSNNSEAAKIFKDEIVKKIETENLLLENVYNADESGIYWKSFPKTTLASQEEKLVFGREDKKDRITALFCCNAAGTNKINLCVIGESAKPRSIKNWKMLPVVYKSQRSGWMDQNIFKEWYQDYFIPAVLEHQRKNNISGKVLLLLDNAPSHPSINILNNINKNFEVKYLPPNVTAVIQPMDQGVISITKKLYKKQFLMKLLLAENRLNIGEFLKNFTLRDCIILISSAWQSIKSSTLSKMWKPMLGDLLSSYTNESSITESIQLNAIEKNNESIEKSVEESVDFSNSISQQLKHHDIEASEIQKWIVTEESDEGWTYLTDTEIVENVVNCYQEFVKVENDNFSEENNDNSDNDPLKVISHKEAYKHLESIKDWCEQQEDCESSDLLVIYKLLENAAKKARYEKD